MNNPYFTASNKDLVLSIAQGNPGALEVTRQLQWFSRWERMLEWLEKEGYKGPRLWELYKDIHHQSAHDLGSWIQKEMVEERSRENPVKLKIKLPKFT